MRNELRNLRTTLAAVMIPMMMMAGVTTASAASPDDWFSVLGTYAQADGSQYNAGKLQLLPLDDGSILFELDVMKGSESAGVTEDFRLPGTLYVEEDGTGTWEGETENGDVRLVFELDGETVTVTQTGTLPVPVEGEYVWLEETLEVTQEAAGALLEGLPTAATSLNANNGEYRLEMSDQIIDGWFYRMKALFTDSGETIGEFLIAGDLSVVYRIDTDEPVLIYGSADSMMAGERISEVAPGEESTVAEGGSADAGASGDGSAESSVDASVDGSAESSADASSDDGAASDEGAVDERAGDESGESYDETEYEVVPLVDAVPSSSSIRAGETATLDVVTPAGIPATLAAVSDKPEVATVDEQGKITAVAAGTAVLSGTITVDGSEKSFSTEITVWEAAIQALDIQTKLAVGASGTMKAQVIGASEPIAWSVSDPALADIDASTGAFTVKKDGQLTLTAMAGSLKREWALTLGTGKAAAETTAAAGTTASEADSGKASESTASNGTAAGSAWIIALAVAVVAVVVGLAGFAAWKRKKK